VEDEMFIENESIDPNDPDRLKKMHAFFGPQHVDSQIRQAIQFCWMALPPERQNVEGVEIEIRRIVDRALRDLRDDYKSFGVTS
jgi:hypothetical protein